MQKLKDIFYDTNDLIVALIIIALAALLIRDRIGVILDYPSANAGGVVYEESGETAGEGGELTGEGETQGAPDGGADAGATETETPGEGGAPDGDAAAQPSGETGGKMPSPSAEPIQYSFYISYGETGAQIAKKLLDAGLINDVNEFYDALAEADAATRLQAGSFIITEGATLAEIVDILTGR
ncbi:MAG: endolytic transglycosylase MltG [Clostridiales Family XIII bacterium]|jgi:hypothetical protein|nr:endolytic transglycosylase MltG [Clostridiales Family XIII bacterium]